jgi:transcriptional regulator with XRE-family HTH domain
MDRPTPYELYLNKVVDVIFKQAAESWTWAELAKRAGVSNSTVSKLGNRFTRFPQLRTVFLLATAVNMDLPAIKQSLALARRTRATRRAK